MLVMYANIFIPRHWFYEIDDIRSSRQSWPNQRVIGSTACCLYSSYLNSNMKDEQGIISSNMFVKW